MDMLYILCK